MGTGKGPVVRAGTGGIKIICFSGTINTAPAGSRCYEVAAVVGHISVVRCITIDPLAIITVYLAAAADAVTAFGQEIAPVFRVGFCGRYSL